MADILHPPHQLQELDLARGRQRGFRFVEDEDALALAALFEEAQKAFAMGMGEEVGGGLTIGSAGGSSRYRATEKKLSARKNQPLPVIFGSQLARKRRRKLSAHFFQRSEWSTVMYPLPPPASSYPASTAMPSSSVDLPVPFSPTMMVIALSKLSSKSSRSKGRQNG